MERVVVDVSDQASKRHTNMIMPHAPIQQANSHVRRLSTRAAIAHSPIATCSSVTVAAYHS
jgi:hypothetical protein